MFWNGNIKCQGVKGVSVKGVKRNSATMRLRVILEFNIYI